MNQASDSRFRVAIAGTGFGEKYGIGLEAHPDVEIAAVFSRRPERAAAMAERFNAPIATRNYEDLLKIPYLDAIAIVTPNNTHYEFARGALRAGKHVICDKPLAVTAGQAADLYELAEQMRVRHVTFVPYRFSPAAAAIKDATAEQQAGRVVSVRASWGVDLSGEPLRWRFQRRLSGPGVIADLGAHVFDLLTWWMGPIRRVLGRCRTLVPERPAEVSGRARPVDVPDQCWALVEFAEAGVGSVKLSWNEKRDQTVEIEGDRARLTYHSPSLLQWLQAGGSFNPAATVTFSLESARTAHLPHRRREHFASPETALAGMFSGIVDYLRGGEKPEFVATFREGTEVLRIIEAVENSNETGRWTEVQQTV